MPNKRLEGLAEEISRVCPTMLVVASDYLAQDAELAIGPGLANDSQQTQDVIMQVRKMLA